MRRKRAIKHSLLTMQSAKRDEEEAGHQTSLLTMQSAGRDAMGAPPAAQRRGGEPMTSRRGPAAPEDGRVCVR
jgi:hypothetical protein